MFSVCFRLISGICKISISPLTLTPALLLLRRATIFLSGGILQFLIILFIY